MMTFNEFRETRLCMIDCSECEVQKCCYADYLIKILPEKDEKIELLENCNLHMAKRLLSMQHEIAELTKEKAGV